MRNLIKNKTRALCEGRTFKAFTTNALLNCIIVMFILGIVAIPTTVRAEEYVEYTYTHNDGLEYIYTLEDEKVTIIWVDSPLVENITEIEIPDMINGKEVNVIGPYAFQGIYLLEKVEIPASITKIDEWAFSGLCELKTVIFEEGSKLETIGVYAFDSCIALEEIKIPASVTSIQEGAFDYCELLKEITFEEGSNLETIENYAFYNCTSLESIEIPSGVTSIGERAFYGCESLIKVEIPSTVNSIGRTAFSRCSKDLKIACKKDTVAYNYAITYNIKYEIIPFQATLSYSNTELTKEPVVVTIRVNEKLSDKTKKQLQEENWVYTEETLKLEKTYSRNTDGIESIKIIDYLDNQIYVNVNVTNIDAEKPILKIVYNPTEFAKQTTVLIMANEPITKEVSIVENGEIVKIEEWNHFSELLTSIVVCVFDENNSINIKVKDIAGNYSEETEIVVTNIKTEIETPEIKYIPAKEEGLTNKNIVAEIDFSNTGEERIEFINNSEEIVVEGLKAQYEFKQNGTYTIYYKDSANNESSVTVEVDWIDKTSPEIEVEVVNKEVPSKTKEVIIKAEDNISGLSEQNEYKYCLTKGEELEGEEEWLDYELGEKFEIGEGKTGTYYLHIKVITDKAGNEAKVETIKIELNNTTPEVKYEIYEEAEKWYISNVSPETSKEEFIGNLGANKEEIEIVTKEEKELVEGKYVGTGMKVKMEGKEYILIVKGDTTGEGKANGQDALAVLFHREGKLELKGEQFKAADLNKDGKINGMDALLLLLHRESAEGYIL